MTSLLAKVRRRQCHVKSLSFASLPATEELNPELSPSEVAATAQRLEKDPKVKAAIEKTLQKRGLDEKSKEHFVDLLWRYAESEAPADEKRQLMAMRILGKAFVGEKIAVDKPEYCTISQMFISFSQSWRYRT